LQLSIRSTSVVAMSLVATACSTPSTAPTTDGGDAAPPCAAGILGDANGEPMLQITTPDDSSDGGANVVVADGGDVVLAFPPQGGRVIFAGARATNIDACGVQMTGILRDTNDQEVRLDSRTVNLVSTGDGWGTSTLPGVPADAQLANYSNIPVCPNGWASTAVFDTPFELVLTLQDQRGKMVSASVTVTPRCPDDSIAPSCRCICALDYILGEACPAPGMSDDAGGE
jgi:hypothetical protein